MINKYKSTIIRLIRFVALVIPFIWIFKRIDFADFVPALRRVEWWTIPMLLLMCLIATLLQGVRWWVLLHAFSKKISFLRSMSYHLSSHFYSLVLPNGSAQEIVRTVFVTKETGSIISWSAAWICKIITVIISFLFSLVGLITISKTGLPKFVTNILIALFVIIIFLVTISFTTFFTRLFGNFLQSFKDNKIISWIKRLQEGIYQYRTKTKELLIVLVITSLMQTALLIGTILVIQGITGAQYIAECVAFIPLIELVSIIQPFTPNGMGVREALVAIMFKYVGLSNEELGIYIIVSNFSILIKFIGAIPALHGLIKKRKSKAKTS